LKERGEREIVREREIEMERERYLGIGERDIIELDNQESEL
jgi:hypothetical protein